MARCKSFYDFSSATSMKMGMLFSVCTYTNGYSEKAKEKNVNIHRTDITGY